MRIIAGRWRGRRIAAPDGDDTRPVLDRAKTVLFDMLGHRLAEPGRLPPVAVLDLFAGSGALGLEALSRGARYCLLVEMHRAAARLIRQNLDRLRVVNEAEVLRADAVTCAFPAPPPLNGAIYDGTGAAPAAYELVFVDPPYRLLNGSRPDPDIRQLLGRLATETVTAGSAMIVVRHPFQPAALPDLSPLIEVDRRDVGKCTLRFMIRPQNGIGGGSEELP